MEMKKISNKEKRMKAAAAEPTTEEVIAMNEAKRKKAFTVIRNKLINEIKPTLLSKSRIRQGGSDVRRVHSYEMSAHTKVLVQINMYGKEIGLPPIGLGHLRKE